MSRTFFTVPSKLEISRVDFNKVGSLDIRYGEIHIKQYPTVTYLACFLDESLSEESTFMKVIINKTNRRLKCLSRKSRFLSPLLRRLLCSSLIQPHFHYPCSA